MICLTAPAPAASKHLHPSPPLWFWCPQGKSANPSTLHQVLALTSPTYFCTSSDPMTLMKQASVLLATARAQRVLPVPGGPNKSTPLGGSIPRFTNLSGCNKGSQKVMCKLKTMCTKTHMQIKGIINEEQCKRGWAGFHLVKPDFISLSCLHSMTLSFLAFSAPNR